MNQIVSKLTRNEIPELESVFLTSFLLRHGRYAICNNQAGVEVRPGSALNEIVIEWSFFD